jgi:hypothetical protein
MTQLLFSWQGIPIWVCAIAFFKMGCRAKDKLNHWLWAVLIIFIPVSVALLTGKFTLVDSMRYFSLSMAVLVVLPVGFLFVKAGKIFRWLLVASVSAVSLFAANYWPNWKGLCYPDIAQQLDALKKPLGLESGLSEYAISKPIDYFSKTGLRVNALCSGYSYGVEGSVFCKMVNLAWLGAPYLPGERLKYNFIVTYRFNKDTLARFFGSPDRVVRLYTPDYPTELWVYNRDLNPIIAGDPHLIAILGDRLQGNYYLLRPDKAKKLAEQLIEFMSKTEPSYYRVYNAQ